MLRFPYSVREFAKLHAGDYVYMDRTQYIPFIEEWGDEVLFLRPRRFGKSLLLSTLMDYYDIDQADNFDKLFGKLAIGQNPTPLHNQYLVMRWDFSKIKATGSVEQITQALDSHINSRIKRFVVFNQDRLRTEVDINSENAISSWESLMTAIDVSGHKLYLFIDEYDNFANEVMMGTQGSNQQRYLDLVKGEGIFKTFFKNVKSFASGDGLDKVFVTGVSPIVLNDVTSGSNTFQDLTWDMRLNELCGFTEAEVRGMVEAVIEECGLPHAKIDEVVEQMRSFYDGSLFVSDSYNRPLEEMAKIYNPTLVFYFLKRFQSHCTYPEEMLDSNLQPDSNKLVYISSFTEGDQLVIDALDDGADVTVSTLQKRFGVKDLLDVNQQREHLAVLLTYLGALTVSGRAEAGEIALRVPNLVMRKLYAEQMLNIMVAEDTTLLTAGRNVTRRFFAVAELQPLCTFVEEHLLSVFDNRDYREFDELTLKALFISMLHYNNIYIMDSEPAILRQYGDLLMLLRPRLRELGNFDFLLEFKYVKLKEVKVDDERLTGQEVRQMGMAALAKVPAVAKKMEDARKQLRSYRQSLQQKYGADLRLRTFAVVGVGLERLVWEEV